MPPKKQTTTDPPIQTDDDAESAITNLLSPLNVPRPPESPASR